MLTRRRFISGSAVAIAAGQPLLAAAQARIQEGVVRLVSAFPAGTAIDVLSRHFAEKLRVSYASTIIVENRAGAAGRIGLANLKSARPDGRAFSIVPSSLMTLYPHVYKTSLPYDPAADFVAVGTVYGSAPAIAVGPSVPDSVQTLEQFVAWAKKQPLSIQFSGNAVGAAPHFAGLRFGAATGIKTDYIPYTNSSAAVQALIAGDIPMLSMSTGGLTAGVRGGKVRLLATFGPKRSAAFPQVPTFVELGYPDLVDQEWGGVFMPAGTPRELIDLMAHGLRDAVNDPSTAELLGRYSLEPLYRTPAETAQVFKTDLERYRAIVARSGVVVTE